MIDSILNSIIRRLSERKLKKWILSYKKKIVNEQKGEMTKGI